MKTPNNSCKRDHTNCCSSNREKIKIIHLQLVVQKINQRYTVILNKLGYINQEKRKIIQRGLLDWLLPIWTLPCVCEIHNEMQVQVVYNELTCDWVKSMVAVAWKVHHQSHLVLCEFFLVEWKIHLEYVIKCRLFTRKWHIMEQSLKGQSGIWLVEYNSSTWKNYTIYSCRVMIGYVLIGLRTLFPWYLMESELFGMCIMSKREEKTCFNLKMIQEVKCDPTIS